MPPPSPFTPALLVIDMQNDFCENGSLAIPGGLALVPLINTLLSLPFALKLASKDWHPADHLSFASAHNKQPFSTHPISNIANPQQTQETTLWPEHCVQNTRGAEFVPGLRTELLDVVVRKGTRREVETYSLVADIFGNRDAGFDVDVGAVLREKGVTHVYLVGLAGDYCVRCSALDVCKDGFETFVVEEGTEFVDPEKGPGKTLEEYGRVGVKVVKFDSEEVSWLQQG